MRHALLFLGALLIGCAPLWAQTGMGGQDEPAPKETPRKEEPKKDEAKKDEAKPDLLKAYRTKGNTWTTKTISKIESQETVTYQKYEIAEVKDNEATVKVTSMDKDQKVVGEPYSFPQSLKAPEPVEKPKDNPKDEVKEEPKPVVEKIKVEAGEFDCVKTVTEYLGSKRTVWTCKRNHIEVKSESTSDYGKTTVELVKVEIR